jgi:hypothetical protein
MRGQQYADDDDDDKNDNKQEQEERRKRRGRRTWCPSGFEYNHKPVIDAFKSLQTNRDTAMRSTGTTLINNTFVMSER